MTHDKHSLDNYRNILELFPIKLVGGFIAVDFHVGCLGCSFCLSRRHPLWVSAFNAGFCLRPDFLTPEKVAGHLSEMRPFNRARVPVRFGHNSDAAFQWDFGTQLYPFIPEENPFIMLTRFPLEKDRTVFFSGQPNLLLKMTIAPQSRTLHTGADIDRLIATAREVHPDNLYVLIGPVAIDSVQQVIPILKRLPRGIWLDIKPLTVTGIPGMNDSFRPSEGQIDHLRETSAAMGFKVTDYFGCVLRRNFDRKFYKAGTAAPYMRATCSECSNRTRCFAPVDTAGVDRRVKKEAQSIGLTLTDMQPKTGKLVYKSTVPVSRGDETCLSELAEYPVEVSNTLPGSQGGCFSLEDDTIHRRWEETGMFPFSDIYGYAEEIYRQMLPQI